jgi:hypothetical protein
MSAGLSGGIDGIGEREQEAGGESRDMSSRMRGIHRPPTLTLLSALHDEVRSMHPSAHTPIPDMRGAAGRGSY